ncbi:MAG: hypothetical protein H6625_11505 [Bdellovibrionaceae bacterium]|nr:hypothetical protein [Pseudobdellovibrionaceae bacterium]
MKKILLVAMPLLLMSFTAQAYEMGLTGGVVTTALDESNSKPELDGKAGYQLGVLGFIDVVEDSFFRTGAIVSNRKFDADLTATVSLDAELMSLEVPITYLMMFSDYAGLFGGLKLGLNLSDKCSVSDASFKCDMDPESIFYAANVGGHFRFVPDFGIEVEYNLGLSDMAKDYKLKNSLGVGIFYLF